MKILGTFVVGFVAGLGATVLAVKGIYKAMEDDETLDQFRFNPCECGCHEEHEHIEEEVLLNDDDKLVEQYFNGNSECELDAFNQEIEEETIDDIKVSTKDLTPQGRAKLEAVLGFELDDNAVLDEASIDMLRMTLSEQE